MPYKFSVCQICNNYLDFSLKNPIRLILNSRFFNLCIKMKKMKSDILINVIYISVNENKFQKGK